jgi:hypothetical protein
MIELPRPILLPPHSAALPGQARAGAVGLPVPVVVPVSQAPAREERNGAALSGWARAPRADFGDDDTGAARTGDRHAGIRRRGSLAGITVTDPGRPGGGLGSLAFLTQQIFQETMSSGLHLEPWAQGIGAYRRAGAEPALTGAGPAQLSVAI